MSGKEFVQYSSLVGVNVPINIPLWFPHSIRLHLEVYKFPPTPSLGDLTPVQLDPIHNRNGPESLNNYRHLFKNAHVLVTCGRFSRLINLPFVLEHLIDCDA